MMQYPGPFQNTGGLVNPFNPYMQMIPQGFMGFHPMFRPQVASLVGPRPIGPPQVLPIAPPGGMSPGPGTFPPPPVGYPLPGAPPGNGGPAPRLPQPPPYTTGLPEVRKPTPTPGGNAVAPWNGGGGASAYGDASGGQPGAIGSGALPGGIPPYTSGNTTWPTPANNGVTPMMNPYAKR